MYRFSFQIYFSGIRSCDSTDAFYNFCSSCSNQSCQSNDLTSSYAERNIFVKSCSGKFLYSEHLIPKLYIRLREQITDLTSNHRFDQICICDSVYIIRSDILGISENCYSCCQTIHIFKSVRNKDNRYLVLFQLIYNFVKLF